MNFEEFITKIYDEEIKDIKELNELIKENFPDFSKKNKRSKNLIRILVSENIAEAEDLEQSLTLLNVIYKNVFSNNSTLDNYFSKDIRKPIFTKFGRYSAQHVMSKKIAKLDFKEKGELIKESKDVLKQKHKESETINPEEIFEIIGSALQSDNPYKQFVGLALCCGSRPIELIEKSTYEKIDDVWIKQFWIAKKKTDEALEITKPIVYLKTNDFIEKLADVRYEIKSDNRKIYKTDGSISPTLEKRLNKAFKELFGERPGWSLYSCRKIYGQISFNLYSKNSIVGDSPTVSYWLSKVLGHAEDNLSTSLNYSTYQIEKSNFNSVEIDELKARIKLLEESLKNSNAVVQVPVKDKSALEINLEKFDSVLKENYEPYMKLYKLEEKLKNKVPRSTIREWYHTKKVL